MRQTLFFIPPAWFEGPLLVAWLVLGMLVIGFLAWRKQFADIKGFLPVWGIGALAIYFLFPQLQVYGVNPDDPAGPFVAQGLAIRGYGVALLLAIVAGVGVTLLRCRSVGISPDQILSLAFWMTICGMLGARSLYVIQKSGEFFHGQATFRETIVSVLDMTKGGLVVYGSLIGGMIAAVVFFRFTKLSMLKTADLIAPGMVLGLAIGRIGCLMNGCCYGGLCETTLPALQFPAGSPPYMQQLHYGDLLGMKTRPSEGKSRYSRVVSGVEPDGIADRNGVLPGDKVNVLTLDSERMHFYQSDRFQPLQLDDRQPVIYIESERQGHLPIPLGQLQRRSLPVHPTQIYSSINAVLLSLLLWFCWTVRRKDGEVFALMLILYSIARFLLEIIRRDESGLFGTPLTISQWVSVGMLILGLGLMGYVRTIRTTEPESIRSKPVTST